MREKPIKIEPTEKSLPAASIYKKESMNTPSGIHKKSDNIQRTVNRSSKRNDKPFLML
ncbi:MAG: hypothetical protein H0V30_03870 [Chitinophagaceae bacterium]|jgi:hypothetical protein|nr:hypothetical protein [Chitinophagaceae bacterium]